MDKKIIVKNQFNEQAEKFSDWSITKNTEYLQRYSGFCGMVPEDRLLDVACGSGEFSRFCAKNVKCVYGVDISEMMIEIAENQAIADNIGNTRFKCHDVENIPVEGGAFSIVVCKSAFHHFLDYGRVFSEMIRCCEGGGRISIQDIVSYEDTRANDFFEELEREIDISHNKTLSKEYIIDLFCQNKIEILRTYEIEIDLNFNEYVNHATQSGDNLEKIDHLLDYGLGDRDIAGYFTTMDGELFFKRNVFLILGRNRQNL
jgi:ubiquinone/menaquinone biosynthesis C-methylase UbiE